MDPWWQVIIEWVNCLELDITINDDQDLKDGIVYKKIIESIGIWRTNEDADNTTSFILNFIKEEYPYFLTEDESMKSIDMQHIASLLLLRTSQESQFQRLMSTKLQHETQLKIKVFLETLLPYGENVNRDIMEMAISELMDAKPATPDRTPKRFLLRGVFTSPAAFSAQKQRILSDRDKEIRRLKSELETERCEKAYLLDDLKIQQEKIQNLQSKLDEKKRELKAMREERMKKPSFPVYTTPESCKNRYDHLEEIYKKEIKDLENYVAKLQQHIDKYEDEKEGLRLQFSQLGIKFNASQEKCYELEQVREQLLKQIETKDKEIIDLRIQNEELRSHMKEMRGNCLEEPSFDCEDVSLGGRGSVSFNSEALSSVVEIQLQEAKEECDKLRAELKVLNKKFEAAIKESRELKTTNISLADKLNSLEKLPAQLQETKEELISRDDKIARLESKILTLTEDMNHVKNQLVMKDETLRESEENEKILKNELNKFTTRLNILDESLQSECNRVTDLKGIVSTLEQQNAILSEKLNSAEKRLLIKEQTLQQTEENEKTLKNEVNKTVARIQILEESLHQEQLQKNNVMITLSSMEKEKIVLIEKLKVVEEQLIIKEELLKKTDTETKSIMEQYRLLEESLKMEQDVSVDLKRTISRLEKEKLVLSEELAVLKCKLDENVQSLMHSEQHIEAIQSERNEMKSIIQSREVLTNNLQFTIQKLQNEKDDVLERMKTMEQELVVKDDLLAQANESTERLKNVINTMELKMKTLDGSLTSEQSLTSDLKTMLVKVENENKDLLKQFNQNKNQMSQAKQDIERLEDIKLQLEMKVQELDKSLTTELSRTDELKCQLSQFELERESLLQKIAVMEQEVTVTKDLLNVAEQNSEELKNRINDLQQQIKLSEELLRTEKSITADLNAKISELQYENQIFSKESKYTEDYMISFQATIEQLKHGVYSLTEEMKNAEEALKIKKYHTFNSAQNLSEGPLKTKKKAEVNCTSLFSIIEVELKEIEEAIRELKGNMSDFRSTINNCTKILQDLIIDTLQLTGDNETDGGIDSTLIDLCKRLKTWLFSFKKMFYSNEFVIKNMQNKSEKNCTIRNLFNDIENYSEKQNQEIYSMIEELKIKDRKITELDEEKMLLEKELNNVKMSLTQQLTELQMQHAKTVEVMSAEIAKLQDNELSLTKKITEYSRDLSNVRFTNKSLEEQLSHNESARTDLEKKVVLLQSQLNQITQDLKVMESIKNALEEKSEAKIVDSLKSMKLLKDENMKLVAEYSSMTDECANLKEQVVQWIEKCKNLRDQNTTLGTQIETLSAQIFEKEQLIKRKTEEETRLKEFVESLENRFSALQSTYEQQTVNFKLQENTLDILQRKLETLGKEKVESELKMKEIIDGLQEVRVRQDAVLETQDKALKEKSFCLDQLTKENDEFKNVSKNLEFEKSAKLELERKCQELQNDLDEHLKIMEASQKEYKELIVQNTKLTKTCRNLQLAIRDLKYIVDRNVNSVSDTLVDDPVNQSLVSLEEIAFVKKEVEDTLAKCDILEEKLQQEKKINKNIQEIKESNVKLQSEMKFLEIKHKTCKDVIVETMKKMKSFQTEISLGVELWNHVDQNWRTMRNEWSEESEKHDAIFKTNQFNDHFKRLITIKTGIKHEMSDFQMNHLGNGQRLVNTVYKVTEWIEKTLRTNVLTLECKDFEAEKETPPLNDLQCNEMEESINTVICKNKRCLEQLQSIKTKIDSFIQDVDSYNESVKNGKIKIEPGNEEKLKLELEKSNKEKKDVKDQLNNMRTRNAKLENCIDSLRNEIKKLKEEMSVKIDSSEVAKLKTQIQQLEEEKTSLQTEKNESLRKKAENFDNRLKEVYDEYGAKLEVLKQKMKTAYNEQITKLKDEQEKAIEERVKSLRTQMEQQCRKHTEEINKYKHHVSELSSQYWDVGEKLIIEKQEKQLALQQVQELKAKLQEKKNDCEQLTTITQRTTSLDRREFPSDHESTRRGMQHSIQVINEETTYSRRHSVRSIQAMGNPFNAEDEEGEIFDNNYLADMKEGRQRLPPTDLDRLSVLQMRNSLCKPHLKSSYPAETQFQPPTFTEEDIKTGGGSDETFNDSLSQSLLPMQKSRKKDRTHPSYKRPGPPTPSRNGGRLSLQGNEIRSPNTRILKEQNGERRVTVTPRRIKDLFCSTKKQDENGTPRNRKISIFRKQRPAADKV